LSKDGLKVYRIFSNKKRIRVWCENIKVATRMANVIFGKEFKIVEVKPRGKIT